MKHCNKCNTDKEELEFSIKGSGRSTICKECHRRYTRNHYQNNKQYYRDRSLLYQPVVKREVSEYVTRLKSRPCMDCKQIFHPCVMDFDHLRDKYMDVSEMICRRHSLKNIKLEIEKCDIVCSNCHRIRTYKRLNGG
jgi:hypothetical protein